MSATRVARRPTSASWPSVLASCWPKMFIAFICRVHVGGDSTTGDRRESNPHLVTVLPHSSALVRQRTPAALTRSDFELRTPDDARQEPIRVGKNSLQSLACSGLAN